MKSTRETRTIFRLLSLSFYFLPLRRCFPTRSRGTRVARDTKEPERHGATWSYIDRRENKGRGKEKREDGGLFLSFTRRDFLRENISTRQEQTGPFTIPTRIYTYTCRFATPRLVRAYVHLDLQVGSLYEYEAGKKRKK